MQQQQQQRRGLMGMWRDHRAKNQQQKQGLLQQQPQQNLYTQDMMGGNTAPAPAPVDLNAFLSGKAEAPKMDNLQDELRRMREESTEASIEFARRRLEVDALRRKLEQTEGELETAEEELQRLQKPQRQDDRVLIRFEQALELNIAREMSVAKEGRMMQKCASRYVGSEPRFVAIDDSSMLLLWCKKPPLHTCSSTRSMDLKTIHRIDFGHEALTAKRLPGVLPWHCFSLRTLDRSYDFVCADEDTTQCFVLAISRLLPERVGAFPSKKKFIAAKAWCKIREVCIHEQRNMHQVFLRAVKRVSCAEDEEEDQEPQLFTMSQPIISTRGLDANMSPKSSTWISSPSSPASHLESPSPRNEFIGVRRGLRSVWKTIAGSGGGGAEDDSPSGSHARDAAKAIAASAATIKEECDMEPAPIGTPGLMGAAGQVAMDISASGNLRRAEDFNAMRAYIAGKHKWPKVGETWLVTDDVKQVSIYKDKECTEWANRLSSKKGPDQNKVIIIEVAGGERVAEIKGTGRMKFVTGWAEIVDSEGVWAIKPSYNKNW